MPKRMVVATAAQWRPPTIAVGIHDGVTRMLTSPVIALQSESCARLLVVQSFNYIMPLTLDNRWRVSNEPEPVYPVLRRLRCLLQM